MGFLSGKRILLTGLASKLSIAYGIAQAMHREGAELAFTYQNDKLNPGSALLTLSYLGAERAIPNYNVMGLAKASLEANVRYMANAMGPEGVRVNAISAGPIRTLAASGIKDFRKMLAHCEAVTPIRRTVTTEDVGNSAAFLCSDLSAGISGEVVHVDGGFSIAAMNELELK